MVVVTIAAHLFPVSPLLGLRLWPQFCLTLCFVSGVKSVNTHTHAHILTNVFVIYLSVK